MASWFDSSSITGLLAQAQKSIDKVLDIPAEEGTKGKKHKPASTETKLSRGKSNDDVEKSNDDTKVSSSSGSWLSGEDSFWGSFTTQTKVENEKTPLQKEDKKNKKTEPRKKEIRTGKNENDFSKKRVSLSKKPENSKRDNGRLEVKKGKRVNSERKEIDKANVKEPNKGENEKEILKGNQWNDSQNIRETDVISSGEETKKIDTEQQCVETISAVKSDAVKSIDNYLESPDKPDGHVKDNKVDNNGLLVKKKDDESNTRKHMAIEGSRQNIRDHVEREENKRNTNTDTEGKEAKREEKSNLPKDLSLMESKKTNVKVTSTGSFEKEVIDSSNSKEIIVENKHPEKEVEMDLSEVNTEEVDLFSSTPLASSTPSITRTKQTFTSVSDLSEDGSNEKPSDEDLLEIIKPTQQELSFTSDIVNTEFLVKDIKSIVDNSNGEVSGVNNKQTNVHEGLLKKENERLLQVIEVRESKLVTLSKENLDLQETNAILRSQLEQLEEVHRTEDGEFEEMKEEFTNRISTAEGKLQIAAKERDLYKKQLEETQQCLSSDMERQLKEFQLLSQQKDQQIVDLMEEGEKLSKEVLQRSNNIKKLRAKEKEFNEENEKYKTRSEAAESEVERLTEILKERDEHKKEQDDAIKKLNAYIQKQDEQLAKQKIELEESSAKLPSLQTALDNAYKEIAELSKVNAATSSAVQEATLSVEMNAKEELRMAMEKLKKESQKDCDVLALEVTDLQLQLSRSEQQAARREDKLRQEIADVHMRLQEAETRNQELTQSVSIATRPLLRQIENLQHSYGSQQASWEKLEKNLTERLVEAQSQQAASQEKERAATEKSMELSSRVATLESQVLNYRQEKSRFEAELEIEKAKSEALEDFKSRETGKVEALKAMHSKELETWLVEKSLLEQQLDVEKSKFESEMKKFSKLEDQLGEQPRRHDIISSKNHYEFKEDEDDVFTKGSSGKNRSRNASLSSQTSLSDNISRGIANGSTAVLEELRATIRNKQGELTSMQSAISTLEAGRESLTNELTTLMSTNENLLKENGKLSRLAQSFEELQSKYNALLQMYGEKQEETEELKLDLQDIKIMYKAQIQELLSGR